MTFIPMKTLLVDALAGGYAVPSFCAWNAESLLAILDTADAMRAPVIVMNGPAEHTLLSPERFAAMAVALATDYTVPVALHLDHGDTIELVEQTMRAGYTSVMLDYSALSFAENVAALRRVVELARPYGVTVEGEIGHVGKADTVTAEGGGDSTLTTPEEALAYVEATGVDALAVSIGNAHGQYTRLPKLDFSRLADIRAAVSIPLVLHGGSGTPEADLQRAIALGMAKINVATDLITAWRETQRNEWDAGKNLWAPLAMAEARQALLPVVEKWLRLTGAAGRARDIIVEKHN